MPHSPLLSLYSDLPVLVSTTLSVFSIRLEPDLLVSTTFQLHLLILMMLSSFGNPISGL